MVSAGSLRVRRERMQKAVHWLTVFIVAIKGVAKLEAGGGKAAVLFAAAAAIALGAIFHHALAHRFRYFDAFFYLIEAAVLFFVAWLHQNDGTTALHLVLYAAAVLYLIAAMVFITKRRHMHHA